MNTDGRTKKSERKGVKHYTSRLQKGGALLDDMRLLVRHWTNGCDEGQRNVLIAENILGKNSRARAADTFRRAFLPRFISGRPAAAWKIVRELESHELPVEVLRPVYYWITARNEPLLYDFVSEELVHKPNEQVIGTRETSDWIEGQLAACGKRWTNTVTTKVAQGMLAALRDFGILEGAAKKHIAASYLPVESFGYIGFALHSEGASGPGLLNHPDWRLFRLAPAVVERMFLEADRSGLLRFNSAGRIIRIDFPADNYREMADVLARTAHR